MRLTKLNLIFVQIGKLEKELKQVEKTRITTETLLNDLQTRLNGLESLRKQLEDEKNVRLFVFVACFPSSATGYVCKRWCVIIAELIGRKR